MFEDYLDDFKSLTRVHHSIGGLYLTDCYQPYRLRSKVINIFPLGFIPRGVSFQEYHPHFLRQIQELERGREMELDGMRTLVTGGIAISTADLPQGNDKVMTNRHNAKKGCRSCHSRTEDIPKLLLSDPRTHSEILDSRKKIREAKLKKDKAELEKSTGVKGSPSPYEAISIDLCDIFLSFFLPYSFSKIKIKNELN